MLSLIVFLPLAGAVAILLLLSRREQVRGAAALFTFISFVLSLVLFFQFDRAAAGVQFSERVTWIPGIAAQYYLGVDGLNLPMVILTTLLGFLAVLISWHIELRPKEYFFWLLVLETGVLGVFTSLDLLLFFLFWEVELVPMYLLISTWGSPPPVGRREYSAMKFVIYTILGSAFMLVGILALYFSAGTFDMMALQKVDLARPMLPAAAIFLLLLVAFAIKLPVFPLHTWLPDAHTDAPTAVSVMLAGVLLKMGGYAIIRICVGIFPEVAAQFGGFFVTLAVVNVIYGALVTLAQRDLKRLIAYSSVSHMGFVLLGIGALTPVALTGASLQMFSHGIITALLFMIAGLVYDKCHTRQLNALGGLAQRTPVLAVTMTAAGLAALGLPGMSGFAAELMVFLGTYPAWGAGTAIAAFGIVLGAGYILWTVERALFGPLRPELSHVQDADAVERIPLFALVAVILVVGVFPSVLTDVILPAVAVVLG